MKLITVSITLLVSIALLANAGVHAKNFPNLCHSLVQSKFNDIVKYELGEEVGHANNRDGLKLLPIENDSCMTESCLSHRLCYINFAQFQDQGKHLQSQVQKSTATIKGFLDTLDNYYKQVTQLDEKLNVLRLKVRKQQRTRKDYELDKAEMQKQIIKSQK